MDKENIKVKSKIPLPVAPLPALPQHLLKKLSDRPPLSTLAGPNSVPNRHEQFTQDLAGPSNANKIFGPRKNSPFKMDTKFVTMQRGCGELNFNHQTFGDIKRVKLSLVKSEPSITYISSDEEHDIKEAETHFADKASFSFRRASASTPAFQTLEPARVKNIKRSLKRPHSKELQGISPRPNRDKTGDERVKRRLTFAQSVLERMLSPDHLQKWYFESLNREYTVDILSYLLKTEKKPSVPPRVRSETRACVINWLMKVNGVDGNPATIQTGLWYLDSVLRTGHVTVDNMQLIAAASYLIATKLQGPLTRASNLVKYSNYAFATMRLLEAEKVILARLKFPAQPVVAQEFLYYFAWWCNKDRAGEIEVAATFLCLCGMMVNKNLCQEYPSVIAAASIRNALLLLGRKELMPRLQKCSIFVAAENKATNISHTCAVQRHAVRTVASKDYGYKFIFEQYGTPPKCIAQTIASAANELAVIDSRISPAAF